MPRSRTVPSYRLHRPSGQAVVTIRTADGERRDVYLGTHNSPESRAEYGRLIAEQAISPTVTPTTATSPVPTVDQILLLFWRHAEQHYRRADGTPTDQLTEYKNTFRPLRRLYGHTPAKDFGPLALKAVRKAFVAAGNCRTLVNSRVGKLKRVFRWAASEQLVPVATYSALATVAGLQTGRSEARESETVGPVDPATVAATLPFLNRQVAGLVRFQLLTGCRPGEAAALRRCDIDTSGDVWLFKPAQHKTKHKGKKRTIAIGPKAREVLKEFFTADITGYLFSPAKAVAEFRAERAANRKTPLYPSHLKHNAGRKKANPKRAAAARYNRRAYLTAITRACDLAFPPTGELARGQWETVAKWWARLTAEQRTAVKDWRRERHWHPNQLRHSHATEVRKRFGLESAGAALGHTQMSATQIYAERDATLATKVAAEMG